MLWEDAVHYAPLATVTVALLAVVVALISIGIQRSIARKRAAIDFFLKTEMDSKMLDAYAESRAGFNLLREGAPLAQFCTTKNYKSVRSYLNVHELMAVGIHQKVFNEEVCYSFWSDEIIRDCRAARELIAHIRRIPTEGTRDTYADLEKLDHKWRARTKREAQIIRR